MVHSADAQVTTTIGGAELTVQYIGNTTYVQYGNIKFMLHDADLQTVIEEIKAVLPADTPALIYLQFCLRLIWMKSMH